MREQSDATKLRIIKSDLKRARELNQRLMRELLERRKWGQMMSNLCFNLAQNEKYDATHRQSMKDCRENWDKIPSASNV
jgi:hypothetical protein